MKALALKPKKVNDGPIIASVMIDDHRRGVFWVKRNIRAASGTIKETIAKPSLFYRKSDLCVRVLS